MEEPLSEILQSLAGPTKDRLTGLIHFSRAELHSPFWEGNISQRAGIFLPIAPFIFLQMQADIFLPQGGAFFVNLPIAFRHDCSTLDEMKYNERKLRRVILENDSIHEAQEKNLDI